MHVTLISTTEVKPNPVFQSCVPSFVQKKKTEPNKNQNVPSMIFTDWYVT